ncbi:substrate-binding domain-containing protein [Mixta sp. Marseille-Q2659]|uniref:substrate-binding domain-containing protein n=1 Tax=Mixta sp. Marseille-Q2659 TaxID=2736607 RepID=UPI0023B8EC5C|nr:substrate-binding domain-containing protein [Mixta sp. Marseille-Q2659]
MQWLCTSRYISLIGHDGVSAGAYSNPPLTTIAIDPLSLGQHAAKQILQRIENPAKPVSHLAAKLTSTIVNRKSAARPLISTVFIK